ncbi:MAG TPA: LamG-like jellyroll fold domain-containing protein, partial [Tepidisphaeraceae bacterium]
HGVTIYNLNDNPTPACRNVTLVNNTITGNAKFGVQVQVGDAQGLTVFNNILIDNTGGAVGVGEALPASAQLDHNVVNVGYSEHLSDGPIVSLDQWQADTGQDGHSRTATAQQLFINASDHDYHLQTGTAPAIDIGIAGLAGVDAPYLDIAGITRPRGADWDAGAYEDASAPDITPPFLRNLDATLVLGAKATIQWLTTEPSDTQIDYGLDAGYGLQTTLDPALLTTHKVVLRHLSPNTLYHYRVSSRDEAGNLARSEDRVFTTGPLDAAPPVLSGIGATDVSVTSATIVWTNDEPGDAQVEYGITTADYGSATTPDDRLDTKHAVVLGDLAPGTTYYFRVKSTDASDNVAVSDEMTFTTAAPGDVPAAGCVGFWRFDPSDDQTVADVTGNGNTGSVVGAPVFALGRDAASGSALDFDGVDDHVRVSRNPSLESSAISVAAWVRLAVGADQAQWATIVKKTFANDVPPIFDSYSLSISPPGKLNVLSFFTGHAGGDDSQLDSPSPLPTGQWVHVAGTYDPSTGQKRLYVNGQMVASTVLTRPIAYDPTPSGDLYFAQDPGDGEAFKGLIDDVGVWSRALSQAEIQILAYDRPPTEPSPVMLTATVESFTRVHLDWVDQAADQVSTVIQRSSDDGASWVQVGDVPADIHGFDDTTALGGMVYRYRVYACNGVNFSDASDLATASTLAGGTGLRGDYFANPDLTDLAASREDPMVNFDWRAGAPVGGVTPGAYSVRWTGQILPYVSGNYTFFTRADDGIRVWVDGQLIIDRWTEVPPVAGDANLDGVVDINDFMVFQTNYGSAGGWGQGDVNGDGVVSFADYQALELAFGAGAPPLEDMASVTLEGGVKHDLTVEYYQSGGRASVKLEWLPPDRGRQVIPQDQLFADAQLGDDSNVAGASSSPFLKTRRSAPAAAPAVKAAPPRVRRGTDRLPARAAQAAAKAPPRGAPVSELFNVRRPIDARKLGWQFR